MKISNQKGAALFLSLVFLLVLTILGISSMNDSVMQTKMSAAIQDSNIALQGAESAIVDAEDYIENNVSSISLFTDSGSSTVGSTTVYGLYSADSSALPDKFDSADWVDTKTQAASTVTGLSAAPRFYIQYMGYVNQEDAGTSINIENYTHESGSGDIYGFKIVARSTGASGNTQRIIESYYGKRL